MATIDMEVVATEGAAPIDGLLQMSLQPLRGGVESRAIFEIGEDERQVVAHHPGVTLYDIQRHADIGGETASTAPGEG